MNVDGQQINFKRFSFLMRVPKELEMLYVKDFQFHGKVLVTQENILLSFHCFQVLGNSFKISLGGGED